MPRSMGKMNRDGIPGDPEDLISVFDACVRVGKIDRAAMVLKRLGTFGVLTDEERIILHNQYLRATLHQLRVSPDPKRAENLHKWYELQIRNKRLSHTAETIACMLKASLISERSARLHRLVTRYMGMAPGEAGLRVLSMSDVLSDQDLAVITQICPTFNFEADPEDTEGPLSAQVDEAANIEDAVRLSTSLPKLQATPQKGDGLEFLSQGLEYLKGIEHVDVSKLPFSNQREIQLKLERDSINVAILKWRQEQKKLLQERGVNTAVAGGGFGGTSLPSHMASWLGSMETMIEEEFKQIEASEKKATKTDTDHERCLYGPLIQQSTPARLAAITILTALNFGALTGVDRGIPIMKLVMQIAKHTNEDILDQRREMREKEKKRRRKVRLASTSDIADPARPAPASTEEATHVIDDPVETEQSVVEKISKPWSLQAKTQVGSILTKVLMESAKMKVTKVDSITNEEVSQLQPAFTQSQQVLKGKKLGVLLMNSYLVEQLKREPIGHYLAKHLPMIVKPKPWKSLTEGGFLESRSQFIRVQPGDVEQRLYTKAAIRCGDLKSVFRGLDVLGKTAWRINHGVLGVMTEAWNRGEEIANMPPSQPDLPIPPEPDALEQGEKHRQWTRTVRSIENRRSALHSQRCFMNLQLEIARAFRNQTLYFPHNVDYRGRAYPMPTYLNHMGADHTRGLLYFDKGKELGARGLRWLKIQLANVYGLDKASFDEREAFATDNLDNIIESAKNPLDGSRWWLKAEDPWQCLAACFELKAAHDLPDPTTYVSHLPVQQDGTCNGLQHYAALGGDKWGAQQVNLEPGDKPADVYSAVANLVKSSIIKDAEEGNPMAIALKDKVTRKVVKQTVMTNVYGVTFVGARDQVCKQIDALYPKLGLENDTTNLNLSTYIAKQIFTALASMFRGAHDIQYWLGETAGRICRALTSSQLDQIAEEFGGSNGGKRVAKSRKKAGKPVGAKGLTQSFRSTVVWTTPLRMPVVQPYRKGSLKEVRTCLQALHFPITDQTDPVNRRKQLQGFPPNFIHSLDASHMLLSAMQCYDQGLDFAAVHDSFWTHAADIDSMNSILREAFIQIHEEDVVGRLATEFKARHHGSLYMAEVPAKSEVAVKIKELRQKSKLGPEEELLLEHKRNTLKLSGNPWDLEAAKQIVTPASVYEDMVSQEDDITIKEDVRSIELGAVPDTPAAEEALASSDSATEADDVGGEEETAAQSRKQGAQVRIWLPLSIPDVPKKVCYQVIQLTTWDSKLIMTAQGDFDVTRLRDSKYFFS